MARLRLYAAALGAAALLSPAAASAATPTTWLCKPGLRSNPCTASLTATVVAPSGARSTERTPVARTAKTDCFYVYPTVSGQARTNATLEIEPAQRAVAELQASRYSQSCRMYAPMYRQLTLRAITVPRDGRGRAAQIAYGDVRDAWREYLRRHNRGRGVLLIGHSQGTYMLRELVKREIDPKPSVRRRLVAAHLIGGEVTVRRGSDRGGDFRSVRACRAPRQTGCVVAYSAYSSRPPADSRFAHADSPRDEVLCTNPGALAGGSAALDAYTRSFAFPGLGVTTPWVKLPSRSTGRCRTGGGASWLEVRPRSSGPAETNALYSVLPDARWGLHVNDMQLALGELTALARRQARAWQRRGA